MRSLEELRNLKADNAYDIQDLAEMFKVNYDEIKNIHIICCDINGDGWSEDANIFLFRDGELRRVQGGHCSCYGFEGQWDEEPVDLRQLELELTKGYSCISLRCKKVFLGE